MNTYIVTLQNGIDIEVTSNNRPQFCDSVTGTDEHGIEITGVVESVATITELALHISVYNF